MANKRKQIRAAVKALIEAQVPSLVGSVFTGRVYAITSTPTVVITTPEEACEALGQDHLFEHIREADLMIEYADKSGSAVAPIDDALDDGAASIENALATDPTLGGLVAALVLNGTAININADGEIPAGAAVLSLAVNYGG